MRWLKSLRCDPVLRETVERALCSEARTATCRHTESAASVLRPHWGSIQTRCNAAAHIAPFSGAAPTMTGAMIFIMDWSKAAAAGSELPSMYGLSAALVTTAIGCGLAIAAVLTLSLAYSAFKGAEAALAAASGRIVEADGRWQRDVNSIRRFLEKEQDKCLIKSRTARSASAV